jgi:methyltransferase (TIGR00027 family)
MNETGHSRTARGAAIHRAAHQVLEQGNIFTDPYAIRLSGMTPQQLRHVERSPLRRPMRLFIAGRSRFAEDSIASAVARGVRQVVVLGAGLDTFSVRNPHRDLHVFEVDHQRTQRWKRWRFRQLGIAVPESVRFVAVDFEHDVLGEKLSDAGFDRSLPAFFMWLGVVPYLTRSAIETTLRYVASMPRSEIVLDYSEPLDRYPPALQYLLTGVAKMVADVGEPWVTFFETAEADAMLRSCGFDEVEDLGPTDIARRYLGVPINRQGGSHVIRGRRL